MEGKLYHCIESQEEYNDNTSIPATIVLEPINLFTGLLNRTGLYKLPWNWIKPYWKLDMIGYTRLDRLIKFVECEFKPLGKATDDRYQLIIDNSIQFIRLLKPPLGCFIFKFSPEIDTLSLIWTPR